MLTAGVASASPGELDPGFGTAGKVAPNLRAENLWVRSAVQHDDKTLVLVTYPGDKKGYVYRYTPDGERDKSFGSSGRITLDPGRASAIVVQADDKFVVASTVSPDVSSSHVMVSRYLPDGAVDTTFGSSGKVEYSRDTYAEADAVAVAKDGTIAVGGSAAPRLTLGRSLIVEFDNTGKLRTSFGENGSATYQPGGYYCNVSALVFQDDGKVAATIEVPAASLEQGQKFYLERLNTDGSTDFAVTDYFAVDENSSTSSALAITGDGKFLVTGKVRIGNSDTDFGTMRMNSDGTLDDTFGDHGRVRTNISVISNDAARAIILRDNGDFAVAGTDGYNFAVAWYDKNGRPASGFLDQGRTTVDFGSESGAYGIHVQSDGKVVLVGRTAQGFALARLLVA
ncbi:hypothetical protein [Kutzneria chonburiensis]|uniref:Delta-60 repeat domain-containing protein n=1 Tax=Kutzneria chonburiensis TaxID=1483604 RepID=A0ABV6MRS2_9PSEU|nr:hypothetical protein [Kutzneria chonburiensis]